MAKKPPRWVVECLISERWLEFTRSPQEDSLAAGHPITVRVMTRGDDGCPRKPCDLTVIREDLLRAINEVRDPGSHGLNGVP